MDELARFNRARWEALAEADISFSRPALGLDEATAREMVDPQGVMGSVAGKDVLCLASGGGQQSAAFGLLGARVTVYDLSETQLSRDAEAAAHYGLRIDAIQGDMRDLARFAADSFDVVWQAHSINFVPDARGIFEGVARALRAGGQYRVACHNPFVMGIDERDWDGECYPLKRPYVDGVEVEYEDSRWTVWDRHGNTRMVEGPKEFRHTLGTMVNGLVGSGFLIQGLWEEESEDRTAAPGTWDHFRLIAPASFTIWGALRPDVLPTARTPLPRQRKAGV
jgi:SAM-dependent methyltransferase